MASSKKPLIIENDKGDRLQLVNNAWVPMERADQAVPTIDPNQFLDASASIEDIDKLKGRANWANTGTIGGLAKYIPGTSAYDFQADIKPITSRGMIGKMIQLKQASPTGATGFGNLSEAEGDTLRSTMGNLDTGQSTPQFRRNLDRARELMLRSFPGLDKTSPIDLSAGQSRSAIPKRAFYKDPYGNIRQNDNGDKGNPIIPMGGNVAASVKKMVGNKNLKAKYGLED